MALVALSIAGCGGGSGGGGSSPGPSGVLTVDLTSVTATARSYEAAPSAVVTATIQAPVGTQVHVLGDFTTHGIASVTGSTSGNTYSATIQFIAPAQLAAGTYADTVHIRACFDQACTQPLSGSPATITVQYTVQAVATVSLASSQVSVSAAINGAAPAYTVSPLVSNASAGVYLAVTTSTTGLQGVSVSGNGTTAPQLQLAYRPPSNIGAGTYNDTMTVTVCQDQACTQPLYGSPLYLASTYVVSAAQLVPTSQVGLSHDVVDSAYSRALNALVTVSSYPTNALNVYYLASGTELHQPLNKVPTAVAISPDGLSAAAGHDAMITWVDLQGLALPTPPAAKELAVTTSVLDLVLDGNGYVHAMPLRDQWSSIHSVNIATNTETLSQGIVYAGSLAAMQPGTLNLYTADNGLSPSSLHKFDVSSGTAVFVRETFGATYGGCGNIWFSDDGAFMYTPCGNVFRASDNPSIDFAYAGQLTTSKGPIYGFLFTAIEQSTAAHEILALERDSYNCAPYGAPSQCTYYLDTFDSTYLQRQAQYVLPPVTVAGQSYPQWGVNVFHSADGSHRYVLGMLYGEPNPAAQYYLTGF